MSLALALAALALPGLGLELALVPGSPGMLVRGVRAFLLSLAFWPLIIFATRVLPVGLGGIAGGGLGLGVVLAGVAGRRRWPSLSFGAWLLAGYLILSLTVLAPLRTWIVAPGADMSMHTFMARLIVEAGGLPSSYEPIYPIKDFGAYAAGFPAIAAVLTRLSGFPVHRTSLALALLSYPALAGGLFLVARRFASEGAALLAGVAVTATCGACDVLRWGGNPTVLSLALGFAALAPLARASPAVRGDGGLLFPIFAAGAGLVQLIPAMALAYAAPLAALLWLCAVPGRERARLLVWWLALLVAAVALFALPYLLATHPAIPAGARAAVMAWQRQTAHAYRGTWRNFPITIWKYLWIRFSRFNGLGVALLGLAGVTLARDRRQIPWAIFALATLLVVLNSRYWILPGSAALYPERVAMLLYAPLTAMLAAFMDVVALRLESGRGRVAVAVLAALTLGASVQHARFTFRLAGRDVAVTANDLEVISFIGNHLPRDAVIANRYADAGLWIPALALRAIHSPHSNPFYFEALANWGRLVRPGYVFFGERWVEPVSSPFRREEVVAAPDRFTEVCASGGAALFKIREN